ncbi:EbsC protein [Strigomonas culicis]|uniref:EbsC protein n=1 Tax=Strigomonas culicis TaxID=28005 RepID=S9UDL9_9TRYP|nr:EbsC protein [Strigomonas culicis]EPY28222.1 EbsC protein [Strigomonas culicis]EPY31740.1 EbsC protein [Strigomonas culicis]|eukprot:EPY26834.1 EbsC protein [Strigomonas culicis]
MEKVRTYFIARGAGDTLAARIQQFPQSSATVEEAATCLRCFPAHVAKSLCFLQKAKVGAGSGADNQVPIVVVTAGHAKADNKKYKAAFGQPSKMLKKEDVEALVGFPPGGVCPFAVNDGVRVYLDVSLKQFKDVYPACGTIDSGMRMSVAELEEYSTNFVEWVDICLGWQEYPGEGVVDGNLA